MTKVDGVAGTGRSPALHFACNEGFYQRDPVALGCKGGHDSKAMVLTPSGTAGQAFRWQAASGTNDLLVKVTVEPFEDTGGSVELTVGCVGDQTLLVATNGSLLTTNKLETIHDEVIWKWSGMHWHEEPGAFQEFVSLKGTVQCDVEISLSNVLHQPVAIDLNYSWVSVYPCPDVVPGCVECPINVCPWHQTAICDGTESWECVYQTITPAATITDKFKTPGKLKVLVVILRVVELDTANLIASKRALLRGQLARDLAEAIGVSTYSVQDLAGKHGTVSLSRAGFEVRSHIDVPSRMHAGQVSTLLRKSETKAVLLTNIVSMIEHGNISRSLTTDNVEIVVENLPPNTKDSVGNNSRDRVGNSTRDSVGNNTIHIGDGVLAPDERHMLGIAILCAAVIACISVVLLLVLLWKRQHKFRFDRLPTTEDSVPTPPTSILSETSHGTCTPSTPGGRRQGGYPAGYEPLF